MFVWKALNMGPMAPIGFLRWRKVPNQSAENHRKCSSDVLACSWSCFGIWDGGASYHLTHSRILQPPQPVEGINILIHGSSSVSMSYEPHPQLAVARVPAAKANGRSAAQPPAKRRTSSLAPNDE
uniref:Uncharacterized protein n=1 Tax=Bionectria ochroleuca TaxID=29856 RepID=A0A8H7N4Q2_BIOOC